MLGQEEFEQLVAACAPLDLSPRAAKRITNTYKIWKTIWYKRGETDVDKRQRQLMVSLLALSTVLQASLIPISGLSSHCLKKAQWQIFDFGVIQYHKKSGYPGLQLGYLG